MTIKRLLSAIALGGLVTLMALPAGEAFAQTKVKPGFNIFSVEQDKEIGRQSAAEVEAQMPIIRDSSIQSYVSAVGKRLARYAPGGNFTYQFKVVNTSDINAFALPGGYMYVNRGLIEAARNEGQLAGVMAHEMAHVALRHGTNQASKAYMGQTGLGLLGGLLGGKAQSTQRVVGAVGGFGLNTLFLKFSRTDETQADIVGSQMMAKAGYDPNDMVDFFEILRSQQSRNPSKVQQFFSDHPAPADRAARIREERRQLTIRETAPVGGFSQARAELQSMPAAQSMAKIAQASNTTSRTTSSGGTLGSAEPNIDQPSSTYRRFQQSNGFFTMEYPDNWRVYSPDNGYGVTLAPEGGFVDAGNGDQPNLVYGVVVNHYDPFNNDDSDSSDRFVIGGKGFTDEGGRISRTSLAEATNDLVNQILRTNSHLKFVPDSQRVDQVDGASALSLVLSGRSPATGLEERVTVFTRELPDDHVIYALFIAPAQDYSALRRTFDRMISSLQVNDSAVHR